MLTHLLLLSSHCTCLWGITWTLSPPDPSTLRDGRGTLEGIFRASRRWGMWAEQPVESCILTCSRAFKVLACTLLRSFGSPVPVAKSALTVKCEDTTTVGSKPSNYLKEIEGMWRFRTEPTLVGHLLHRFFYLLLVNQVFSVAPKYRQKCLKELGVPFGKWPSLARSPRECWGFAFYRELEWDNPESMICCCLIVFIYKPLQKNSIRSGALVLAKCCLEAHIFLHKHNRLEVKVHCGNIDRP